MTVIVIGVVVGEVFLQVKIRIGKKIRHGFFFKRPCNLAVSSWRAGASRSARCCPVDWLRPVSSPAHHKHLDALEAQEPGRCPGTC